MLDATIILQTYGPSSEVEDLLTKGVRKILPSGCNYKCLMSSLNLNVKCN